MARTFFVGPWELSRDTALLPETPRDGRVLLVESTGKGAALPYHRKKLVLVLAALRHFRDELRTLGFEVDHRVAPSYAEGIAAHAAAVRPAEVVLQQPAEWGIQQSIDALARDQSLPCPLRVMPDRRFLTPREAFADWASGRKQFRMEDFYRWQRRRLRILVTGAGQPIGGQWNFDPENRKTAKALKGFGLPPTPARFPPDDTTRRVMRLVDGMADHWGATEGFDLPVTRAQALEALEDFITHRLRAFGPFEDAMLSGEAWLYHSRLSPAMNVGLLHPREIVERVMSWWEAQPAREREELLPSVEGFIRQVIGWREYVNGIYWHAMPGYRSRNFLGLTRPLPQLYWEPEQTAMACLRDVIGTVREHGYAHHIPRLMVLANFATLAGVHPLRLSEWFWAGFVDAMEWVELPNVIGMATHADGGLLASKPYVASASYINRMSDYCGGCPFDPSARSGDSACPFNFLYWTFLDDLGKRLADGPGEARLLQRMALALRSVERVPPAELAAMHQARRRFLDQLVPDQTGWTFDYDQG